MELKTHFRPSIFSQISHELRTPLTGILGMIYFLGKTPLNGEQKEYVESIRTSAEELGSLEAKIGDLLKTIFWEPPMMTSVQNEFKILLVEDQPTVLKIHKMMLEEIGYRPAIAENGQQAIVMAQAEQYGLILMDIGLPGIDGIEAAKQIKQTERGKATPIVALTAYAIQDVEEQCLAAGMDKVLSKPMTSETLRQFLYVYSIKHQGRQMRVDEPISKSNGPDNLTALIALPAIAQGACRELLEDLAISIPPLRLELDKIYQDRDIDTLVWVINREYGALCYTGTPQLQLAFRTLETSLRNGEIHRLEELYRAALRALDMFEAAYQELFYDVG